MTTTTIETWRIPERIAEIDVELNGIANDINDRHDAATTENGSPRDFDLKERAAHTADKERILELETEKQTLTRRLENRSRKQVHEDEARANGAEGQAAERLAQLGAITDTHTRSGIPSLVPSEAEIRGIAEAIVHRQPYSVETRATVDLAAVGGEVQRPSGRPVPEPRRIATAVGIPAERVPMRGISGEKYGLEAAAAPTAEGGTKPEYDAVTPVNLVPQAFARWTDVTEQSVEAMGGINDLIAAHARQIALDEDDYLIGLMTTEAGAAIAFDADVQANVRSAIAAVEATVAARADIVVVHPDDYGLFAGTFPANGPDVGSRLVTFSGALLYPSNSATAGIVLVGALAAVAKYVTATDLRTSVQPDVKTNVATVRTEIFADYGFLVAGGVRAVDVVTP